MTWQLWSLTILVSGVILALAAGHQVAARDCLGFGCFHLQAGQVLGETIYPLTGPCPNGASYVCANGSMASGNSTSMWCSDNSQPVCGTAPTNNTPPGGSTGCQMPSNGCGTGYWDQAACACRFSTPPPSGQQQPPTSGGTFFCYSLNRQATAAECDAADKARSGQTNTTQPASGGIKPCEYMRNELATDDQCASAKRTYEQMHPEAKPTTQPTGAVCPSGQQPECPSGAPTVVNGTPTCPKTGESWTCKPMMNQQPYQGFQPQQGPNQGPNQGPMMGPNQGPQGPMGMNENQFKQEQKNITNTVKRITNEWNKALKNLTKLGGAPSADCQQAFEDVKTASAEAGSATAEDFNPGDFYSTAQPMQNCIGQMYNIVQFYQEIKRTTSEIKSYTSSLKSYTTRVAKIKGDQAAAAAIALADYSNAINAYKAAIEEAKASVAESGEVDMGGIFSDLGDKRQTIMETRGALDAMINLQKFFTDVPKRLTSLTKTAQRLKDADAKAEALGLIEEIKTDLTDIKSLLADKDFESLGDAVGNTFNKLNDLQMLVQPNAAGDSWMMPQNNNLNFVPAQYQQQSPQQPMMDQGQQQFQQPQQPQMAPGTF